MMMMEKQHQQQEPEVKEEGAKIDAGSVNVNPTETCHHQHQKRVGKAYTSKFAPGWGPGLIVGLPQTWPVFPPIPMTVTGGATTPNPSKAPIEPEETSNSHMNIIKPKPISLKTSKPSQIQIQANKGKCSSSSSAIAEVTIPKPLRFNAQAGPGPFEELLQDWVDREHSVGKGAVNIVAELANQLFTDNDELLYVLITNVESYPITTKPELWFREGAGEGDGEESGKICFNCLFSVGPEIFCLFLFSPMDIVFALEMMEGMGMGMEGEGGKQKGITSVFFHGMSSVNVNSVPSRESKLISIQFYEHGEEEEEEDEGEEDGVNGDENN